LEHYSETRRNEALSLSSKGESKAREIVEKVEKDLQHWINDLHNRIRLRINTLTREEIQMLWDYQMKAIRFKWQEVITTPVLKKKKYISLNPVLSDIVSSSLLNSLNDENLSNDTFLNNENDDALHYSETRRDEALSLSLKAALKAREIIEKDPEDSQQSIYNLHEAISLNIYNLQEAINIEIYNLHEAIRINVNTLTREQIQSEWDHKVKEITSKWEEEIQTIRSENY